MERDVPTMATGGAALLGGESRHSAFKQQPKKKALYRYRAFRVGGRTYWGRTSDKRIKSPLLYQLS